jgi:chromosome segregation protein
MRLSKIKLAGFKSFVDPTSIQLSSNLVGIVGPNGCGKSNIIDAIRWVMGESSAKHLRGESMADVIFNGSSARKPVGQATIELIFDNRDGTLGGQYAEYNEIAIKRIVSRDGTSTYHLNGARCRRKDITDIFLGTGLGPRSYAIIEQGMISRLIDAKPEELRVYIEEAAGISKYKERRRETQNRIRHTRENLDRLNDLLEEITKQINHLQRQANTAEKYKVLKQEERVLKAQLLVLKWQVLNEKSSEQEGQIKEQDTLFEKQVADQRSLEAELEKQREEHVTATDSFNEVQERFYSVGADISRVEQSIQHARDRRHQQQEDLTEVEKGQSEARAHLDMDQRQIEDFRSLLIELEPQLEKTSEAEHVSGAAYSDAEQTMTHWQEGWENFNQQSAEISQNAEVMRTRIQHLEDNILQLKQRCERLEQEHQQFTPQTLHQDIETIQDQLVKKDEETASYKDVLNRCLEEIDGQRDNINNITSQLAGHRKELQSAQGRQASLEALQQAALGKNDSASTHWLESQNLQGALRLAQSIKVDKGWEQAVECVLGFNLEAVCVDGFASIAEHLESFEEGALTFFDKSAHVSQSTQTNATPLASKVSSDLNLDGMLVGVYVADSLQDALALRSQLAANESVVTPEGIWLSQSWLRVTKDEDEKTGVLQREQELKALSATISTLDEQEQQFVQNLENSRITLKSQEDAREKAQSELDQINRQRAEVHSDLSARQARLEQMNSRIASIKAEIFELRQNKARDEETLSTQRSQLAEIIEKMAILSAEREELITERDQFQAELEKTREQAKIDRENAHEIALKIQSTRTGLESAQQSLERIQKQFDQLGERRESLHTSIQESEAPLQSMGEELQLMLDQRVGVETELGAARSRVEDIDHLLRELTDKRNIVEKSVQETRSGLDESRLAFQEIKVRSQTLREQFAETEFDFDTIQSEMPEEANHDEWEENTTKTGSRIQRLGAINLAAIEEFEEQSERKEYLDSQHADLTEALETLESAIQKIDKETRERFKETFENINDSFKTRFPKLFGGGQAYLDLTGDDLLEAGVTIMARPPGKRNSTIHLLSGGEKAMTAIALVFAIFELNPAPFCLLDEVDAPLDDANVQRFCDVVKEMSEKVQFMFITHNKITMEIAKHLNGVTMQEAGVSRMVAVDVDEAVEMAAM